MEEELEPENSYYEEECDTSEIVYEGEVAPLRPGDIITVKGRVLPLCERFSINLLSVQDGRGKTERDVALHINPRVSQRYLVRNTRISGKWGSEETAAPTPFPLNRGNDFTIDIFVADDHFFLQVNRVHFCQFSFRTPLNRVCGVEVRGTDVEVKEVQRGHAPSYPSGRTNPPKILNLPNQNITWESPTTGVLERGLSLGQQLVICGRIKLLPHSFYINLQSSVHLWPHPDVALHINPRFMQATKHIIIWNTWQNGNWDNEQRTETKVLVPGAEFQIRIQCEEDHYSVWEKEWFIGQFRYRVSRETVRAAYIYGDVSISDMYISDSPSSTVLSEEI